MRRYLGRATAPSAAAAARRLWVGSGRARGARSRRRWRGGRRRLRGRASPPAAPSAACSQWPAKAAPPRAPRPDTTRTPSSTVAFLSSWVGASLLTPLPRSVGARLHPVCQLTCLVRGDNEAISHCDFVRTVFNLRPTIFQDRNCCYDRCSDNRVCVIRFHLLCLTRMMSTWNKNMLLRYV